MYAVRTNRVLLLSSGIAAAVNSMPAILTENDEDIDWGGGFTTVLNAFNSVNFWIEIKSQYLASEYKKEIDKQMAILDKEEFYAEDGKLDEERALRLASGIA